MKLLIDYNYQGPTDGSADNRRFIGRTAFVIVSLLVAASVLTPLWTIDHSTNAGEEVNGRPLALTPHYPIEINNNLEFSEKALAEGWSGTGTEADPYVISGLEIVGNNTVDCISVSNTTVHFVIRDCLLRSGFESEIYMLNAVNAMIENNTMKDGTFYAIYTDSCDNITISNNSVYGGTHGIGIGDWCRNVVLSGNVVTNSSWWGTWLLGCNNVTLRDNQYYGSGIQVYGLMSQLSSYDIDVSNTVEGLPIYYISDTDGGTVPTGAGQVILANCTNMTVESQGWGGICRQIALEYCSNCIVTGNNITPAYEGILLVISPSNTIDNNTVTGGHEGIRMDADSRCRVENNSVSNCLNYGIFIQSSDFVSIVDNYCDHCWIGTYLNGVSYSEVSRNWIDNCSRDGLRLVDTAYASVTFNVFADNSMFGFYATYVDHPNLVVNNSFIRNHGTSDVWTPGLSQAYDDSGVIEWSQASSGNYWLDWQSPDDNGDGIVDFPYIISGGAGATDPYPLTTAPPILIPEFGVMPVVVIMLLALTVYRFKMRQRNVP